MRKRNIVAARYANAVLQRGVWELHWKHPGENAVPVTECSQELTVMSTTVDLTETASPCAKHFINVKSVTKSSRTRKGSLRITCVEKACVGIVKNVLTPILADVL